MSSPTSIPAVEAITILTQSYSDTCCSIAVAAVILYEHIVTLDREVLAIWTYRMTGPTILLLLNRYVLLLSAISNLLMLFWTSNSNKICNALISLNGVVFSLAATVAAGFSALRVYAITERSWFWALLALLTGLVPAASHLYMDVYNVQCYVELILGVPISTSINSIPANIYNRTLVATATCTIASDVIVVGATWLYALPWAKQISDARIKRPLMLIILRDGTGYFIVFTSFNIFQSVVLFNKSVSENLQAIYIAVFLPAIAGILISRFMFNLRRYTDEGISTQSNNPSFVDGNLRLGGSIAFESRLVGNMGAPLDHSMPDSLLFDDGDEFHEDNGCDEELVMEQTPDDQGSLRDEAITTNENAGIGIPS